MAKNSRFQQGSGVYKCGWCGILTRETGSEESSVELCVGCYDRSVMENRVSDYGEEEAARDYGITPATLAQAKAEWDARKARQILNRKEA